MKTDLVQQDTAILNGALHGTLPNNEDELTAMSHSISQIIEQFHRKNKYAADPKDPVHVHKLRKHGIQFNSDKKEIKEETCDVAPSKKPRTSGSDMPNWAPKNKAEEEKHLEMAMRISLETNQSTSESSQPISATHIGYRPATTAATMSVPFAQEL